MSTPKTVSHLARGDAQDKTRRSVHRNRQSNIKLRNAKTLGVERQHWYLCAETKLIHTDEDTHPKQDPTFIGA